MLFLFGLTDLLKVSVTKKDKQNQVYRFTKTAYIMTLLYYAKQRVFWECCFKYAGSGESLWYYAPPTPPSKKRVSWECCWKWVSSGKIFGTAQSEEFFFFFWGGGGSAVEKYLVLYKARSVFGVLLEMDTLVGKYLVLYKARSFLGGQVVGKSLVLYKVRSVLGVLLQMGK